MSDTVTLSPAVPKPKHVEDTLVYDSDKFRDPGYLGDQRARIDEVNRNAPAVFWTPRDVGHAFGPDTLHLLWDA